MNSPQPPKDNNQPNPPQPASTPVNPPASTPVDDNAKIEVSSPSDLPTPQATSNPQQPATPPPEKAVEPLPTQPQPQANQPSPTPEPKPAPQENIETSDHNVPVQASPKIQPTNFKPMPMPPIKKQGTGKAVAIITSVAIAFLIIGFSGGFFGYKYVPKFKNLISSSADTSETDNSSQIGSPISANSEPGDISAWPIYSNTTYKYSIKYPDTWYNQGANDPTSKTVLFSSFKPDESSTNISGYKVEIVFQDSNGKTLKDWIDANNVVSGASAQTPEKIQVSNQDAYQQQINGTNKNITAYISRTDKIMIITYYGPENTFATGKALYDKMISSIKLE